VRTFTARRGLADGDGRCVGQNGGVIRAGTRSTYTMSGHKLNELSPERNTEDATCSTVNDDKTKDRQCDSH